MSPDEVFEVSIWFRDGHRQKYKVTRSLSRGDYIFLKSTTGETYTFRLGNIAGFSEPSSAELWEILENAR